MVSLAAHHSLLFNPFFHRPDKAIKQIIDVLWSRARFGVALETERRLVGQLETLQSAIKQRHMRHSGIFRQCVYIHSKTMVLAGDHYALALHVLHRMVRAAMAELHLQRLGTDGQTHKLVTQTDTYNGMPSRKNCCVAAIA